MFKIFTTKCLKCNNIAETWYFKDNIPVCEKCNGDLKKIPTKTGLRTETSPNKY